MIVEHTYYVCKSSWGIYVKLSAEYFDMDMGMDKNAINVGKGIWLKFAEKPLLDGEKFCQDDLPHLLKGLQIVEEQIRENSRFNNTLIVVQSVQITLTDFQEEGLTAAIIEWAAKAFGFEQPVINVQYDRDGNRYIFDF